MTITIDEVGFAMARGFNRTLGKVLNWDHQSITVLGISFMLKSTVIKMWSKEAMDVMKEGLSDDEWIEMRETLVLLSPLPRPGLPNGMFTESQKHDYGITLIANTVYAYRVN